MIRTTACRLAAAALLALPVLAGAPAFAQAAGSQVAAPDIRALVDLERIPLMAG